jgi:hypothetical protein
MSMDTDTGWVEAALRSQEEHIKRSRSCRGVVGASHGWSDFRNPRTGQDFQACIVCDVTRSLEDYEERLAR